MGDTGSVSEVNTDWTCGPIGWVREIWIRVQSCALHEDVTHITDCISISRPWHALYIDL